MRTINEIYEGLKRDYYELCGRAVTEGGDMSLRLMAVAAEIFSLEAQCDFAKRQAFPQTAAGEYLDMHAGVRAISRREAAKATGVLRFSISEAQEEAISVPAGTECLDALGRVFVTRSDAEIAAGATYCEAAAEAEDTGEEGNVAAGAIIAMRHAPARVSAVTNPEAFTGGCAAEDDEALRERVMASYRRLPNGANAAYYEALALSVPGVEKVLVLPRARGRGTVDIIFSASGGLPSDELLAKVQSAVEECREICVDVAVSAPETVTVDVAAELTVAGDAEFETVKAAAEAALRAHFGGGKLGGGVYAAKLLAILMAVDGVENCRLSSPTADTAARSGVLPVLGSVVLTEAV